MKTLLALLLLSPLADSQDRYADLNKAATGGHRVELRDCTGMSVHSWFADVQGWAAGKGVDLLRDADAIERLLRQ